MILKKDSYSIAKAYEILLKEVPNEFESVKDVLFWINENKLVAEITINTDAASIMYGGFNVGVVEKTDNLKTFSEDKGLSLQELSVTRLKNTFANDKVYSTQFSNFNFSSDEKKILVGGLFKHGDDFIVSYKQEAEKLVYEYQFGNQFVSLENVQITAKSMTDFVEFSNEKTLNHEAQEKALVRINKKELPEGLAKLNRDRAISDANLIDTYKWFTKYRNMGQGITNARESAGEELGISGTAVAKRLKKAVKKGLISESNIH